MFELLSPAGDMEKIKTAILFGADAVYCGGPSMHLRAKQAAMSMEQLEEGIKYAHSRRKKAYVTVNAFARNGDFELLPDYFNALSSMGADAVIVSDPGVLTVAAKTTPYLPVHVSTQANCLNYVSANTYYQLGARRIILARELSLAEIREIRDRTPEDLELEVFVHGAMCMSYSGRCLISAFLAGRDSNKGDCAQPCRWKYKLVEESRPDEPFPIYEDGEQTTIMSSRDLNTLAFIDEIKSAGVTSFKIEGRMKSPYYVATVTNAYRHALDATVPIELLQREIDSASHRNFSSGFFYGELTQSTAAGDGYAQDCVFIAVVKGCKGGKLEVEQRNRFSVGETLEVLSPNSLGDQFTVTAISDDKGNEVLTAPHPQQKLFLDCPLSLADGDILRRRRIE